MARLAELSRRQRQFVEEYASCRNGAAAAVRAGYAPGSAKVTASRLLTKANVRAALGRREADARRALAVSRQRVLDELQAAIDLARLKADPAAMIAGWREIAKICGLYAPEEKRLALSADRLAEVEALSDEELLGLIGNGSAA